MTIKIDDPKAAQGKNVLADFDLFVRVDIVETIEGWGPHPFTASGHVTSCGDGCCREETCGLCNQHEDANPNHEAVVPVKEVFGIGWPEELGAGIRGGYLNSAPFFDSVLDALEWAADNEALIEEECA